MSRNQYGGKCYRCGEWCGPGDGHFERHKRGWRLQHAGCAIVYRNAPGGPRLLTDDEAKAVKQHIREQKRFEP